MGQRLLDGGGWDVPVPLQVTGRPDGKRNATNLRGGGFRRCNHKQ